MAYTPHSYITVDDANELLSYVMPSPAVVSWTEGNVSDSLKVQALHDASYYFDSLPWQGFKEETGQPYAFPRVSLPGESTGDRRDPLVGTSVSYVNGKVPYPVGVALALTAAHFAHNYLNKDSDPDALLSAGYKSVTVGSIKVEMVAQNEAKATLPELGRHYLEPYLQNKSSGRGLREFRFI